MIGHDPTAGLPKQVSNMSEQRRASLCQVASLGARKSKSYRKFSIALLLLFKTQPYWVKMAETTGFEPVKGF